MSTTCNNHIICIGAVYIDTILTVPHFPAEDEKLRAKALTRRRGGNTANALEVLTQLLKQDPLFQNTPHSTKLHLLCVLPDRKSDAVKFIRSSLPNVDIENSCIFRPEYQEAALSYAMQSQETLSRTIVSINELPELTVQEFKDIVVQGTTRREEPWTRGWFHFEGRIPDTTLQCVRFLRSNYPHFKISVECEKPERTGMAEVAKHADVVFYSKLWAEKHGYKDTRSFLEAQLKNTREEAILCCTWGAGGAEVVSKTQAAESWADSKAWQPDGEEGRVVDTIGAGDTFIAGMLFALNNHADDWSLEQKLGFANQLAGRKVFQEGFEELGSKMW